MFTRAKISSRPAFHSFANDLPDSLLEPSVVLGQPSEPGKKHLFKYCQSTSITEEEYRYKWHGTIVASLLKDDRVRCELERTALRDLRDLWLSCIM